LNKTRRVSPSITRTSLPVGGHGTPSTREAIYKKKKKKTPIQAMFEKKR
jgi:hypothetical protein